MKNKLLLIAITILISLTFFSCSNNNKPVGTKTIGVSLLTRGHIFYRDLEDGLMAGAEKNGYQLIITSADFDLGKQISQVEDFIARKVDAIVVCPVDSKGVGSAIYEANKANIPVFTADIAAEEGNIVSHIASDNIAGGRLAGEFLAKFLGGKGNLAIINQPAITSVLDRVKGFMEAISKYPGIKIVADVNGYGVRDRSLQAAADALQSHPDLNGIFGINDDSALGALDAVKQFNRKGIAIVGYDATPPARKEILSGSALKADVIQNPNLIGSTTVEKIKEYFEGKTVPKIVPVDVGIVDQAALEKESK
ncbi:MAG TPA: substrate-binding domain-containing protein [Ignavibacteriaceae bacterium]|nr:substrate-binding domain-containing protein [Ignavibacteriaceae bacterium]